MNSEYLAYKEELESRTHYTMLNEEEMNNFYALSQTPKNFSFEKAAIHPFTWAYHIVGVKPRDYQFKLLDDMMNKQRVVGCTSRQIGKSTCIALFAFWAAYNNIYPSGPQKDTKIMIVSHTEQAAKELIRTIDGFISLADARMAQYTKDNPTYNKQYFKSKVRTQTQFEITFAKGSIVAYPPTGKVRGRSIDVLCIDEAAWLTCPDPDYFFSSDALPTTTATSGKVFLFSTPKSTNGFFHDILKPDQTTPVSGWSRIWFPWTVVGVERIIDEIWEKRLGYIEKGDEQNFKVEYEASFLSGKFSFFTPESIDNAVDVNLGEAYTWDHSEPVTLGIDFGDTHSRTVVTVAIQDKNNKKIRILTMKEFPSGYNNADLPNYVYDLKRRYRIGDVVVDDCVGGKTAIELMKRKGFKIIPFNFTKSKNEYYEYLKIAFLNGRITIYNDPAIAAQLKSLESSETINGRVQIKKPRGGRDDICDSIMLACSQFITPPKQGNWRFAGFTSDGKKKPYTIKYG